MKDVKQIVREMTDEELHREIDTLRTRLGIKIYQDLSRRLEVTKNNLQTCEEELERRMARTIHPTGGNGGKARR